MINIIWSFFIKEVLISDIFIFISSNLRLLFFSSDILFERFSDSYLYCLAFLKEVLIVSIAGTNKKIDRREALKIPKVGLAYLELRMS